MSTGPLLPRRSVIAVLGAGIATLFLSVLPGWLRVRLKPGNQLGEEPLTPVFPVVRHLPRGYREVQRSVAPAGGFRNTGKETLIVFKKGVIPSLEAPPLLVFLTPTPAGPFATTRGHVGQRVSIRGSNGVATEGTYHDGMWKSVSRDQRNVNTGGCSEMVVWRSDENTRHSLIFPLGKYTVGIRGARDLSLEDLMAVASSIQVA